MNERIFELADQAGLKHYNWITNESNVKDGDFKYPRLEDYEKFAELIVAEMLQTCEDHPAWTGRMIGEEIKEHFGVEE